MRDTLSRPEGRVQNSPLFGLAAGAFFVLLLILSMSLIIAPATNYHLRDASFFEYASAALTSVIAILCIPSDRERASTTLFSFLVGTVALSVAWIPVAFGEAIQSTVLLCHLSVILGFGVIACIVRLPRLSFYSAFQAESNARYFDIIIAFLVVACFAVLFVVDGLRPSIFTLSEVYEVRDEYGGQVSRVGSYVVGNLANGVLPIAIAWSAYRRNWVPHGLYILAYFLLYTMTGFRSYFIALALILIFIHLSRLVRRTRYSVIIVFAVSTLFAVLVDWAIGGLEFTSLLVRRAIATIGRNTSYYVDFFSSNQPYGLASQLLGLEGDVPYPYGPATLIGVAYSDRAFSANANFLADGWATTGLVGAVLMACIVGAYLYIYDSFAEEKVWAFAVPSALPTATALANTSALTVMVSHGGLVLLVLLALAPAYAREEGSSPSRSSIF